MYGDESQPLLDGESYQSTAAIDRNDSFWTKIRGSNVNANLARARKQTQRFLKSKYGHYAVLLLVSLDVSCIFADFLISLYICDKKCGKKKDVSERLPEAQDALGIVSLSFSSLFMLELLASVWAFGLQ